MNAIGASVHLAANQLIANSAFTAINFTGGTALDFDTSAFFSAGSPTLFTMPFAGLYLFSASIFWDPNATGQREITFAKNGAIRFGCSAQPGNNSGDSAQDLSVLMSLAAGDTVALNVLQNSGGNLNANGSTTQLFTFQSVLGFH